MKKRSAIWIALGLFFALGACVRDSNPILPHTYLIFPTDAGKYRITYVIDSTFNTSGAVVDQYFRKTQIGANEVDLTGRTVQRLELFRSDSAFGTDYRFEIDRVWTMHKDETDDRDYYAEQTEDNRRYLKLRFPVYKNISWNGNLYNDLGTQVYRYLNVDSTVIVRGKIYQDCVVVLQRLDTTSAIFDRFAYEIYSPNIGLVKKYDRVMVFDGPQGQFNPSRSRIYVEEIEEHN